MAEPFLSPRHREELEKGSGLSWTVASRGVRTVESKDELRVLGFSEAQCRVPCMLFPVVGPDGGDAGLWQIKPDSPRLDAKGRPRKYEMPGGSSMRLDFHAARVRPEALRDPGVPLWITEGLKKVDAAIEQGLFCIGVLGVWNWRGKDKETGGKAALPEWDAVALNGRRVYLAFDSDLVQKAPVAEALRRLKGFLESKKASVRIVMIPSPDGRKVGLDDWFVGGGTAEELARRAAEDLEVPSGGGGGRRGADRLVELALEAGLEPFADANGRVYASFPKGAALETVPERDMAGFLWEAAQKAGFKCPSPNALKDAAGLLAVQGRHGGATREVRSRVFAGPERAWLFLADEAGTVLEIDRDGWRPASDLRSLPVRFARFRSVFALPMPERPSGPRPSLLRLLNIEPSQEPVAWAVLMSVFLPSGTLPVAIATGEQGSGKTRGMEFLRRIVDPVAAPLPDRPLDARTVRGALEQNALIGFDNRSGLSGEASDMLCSLASGQGIAAHAFYTESGELYFKGRCPVLLTSIVDPAGRPDLADRSLVLRFKRLEGTGRRLSESDLEARFNEEHALLLGELLERVSRGYRSLKDVAPPDEGRLIDLARWATAGEPEEERGAFLKEYLAARKDQSASALDESAFLSALVRYAREEAPQGFIQPTTLLDTLAKREFPDGRPPADWPRSARAMSDLVARSLPILRTNGVEVARQRRNGKGQYRLIVATPPGPVETEGDPTGAAPPSAGSKPAPTVETVANVETLAPLGGNGKKVVEI